MRQQDVTWNRSSRLSGKGSLQMTRWHQIVAVMLLAAASACAQPEPQPAPAGGGEAQTAPAGAEPAQTGGRGRGQGGGGGRGVVSTADLTVLDGWGRPLADPGTPGPAPARNIAGMWEPADGPGAGIQANGPSSMPSDGKSEPPYTPAGKAAYDSHQGALRLPRRVALDEQRSAR